MEPSSTLTQKKQKSPVKAILFAGLLAGFLDASAASIVYYTKTGKSPAIVFRYIASAVLGADSYAGGAEMTILGLVFHFLIAMLFTLFFFLIYPRLSKNILVNTIGYGLFAWVVMNLLVVPMTKIATKPIDPGSARLNIAILIVCIGLPVAVLANNFYKKQGIRN